MAAIPEERRRNVAWGFEEKMTRQIDLHGRSLEDAMRAFVTFYNDCLRSGYRGRIEVVHGYGSSGVGGVILRELRSYLAANAGRLEQCIHGESVGNIGLTVTYPKSRLPQWRAAADLEVDRQPDKRRGRRSK